MKKTPWFPASTPPKRLGFYECRCGELHEWDGKFWHIDESKFRPWNPYLAVAWRGLTKEAK